eukprot:TRINITY_DN71693_c0_g1_i1.p1 TRINITY_DN71693_c0_g1~~TRINITY_DN71693_c0_g1_i1.p1  ORF type:complete len:441 (+),score=140.28 TRINITY_DN71693_c0_g1_i1:88-1410(+)
MVYRSTVQPGDRHSFLHFHPGERLIFRWRGTVLPRTWRMCVISSLMALLWCVVYDPLRRSMKYKHPHDLAPTNEDELWFFIFHDAEKVFQYVTAILTLLLGFFNFTAYNRWWRMRELCGTLLTASSDTASIFAAYWIAEPQDGGGLRALREVRRRLMRYLGLSLALAFQAVHRVRDLDYLERQGLLERDSEEWRALQRIKGPGYQEVYGWAAFYAQDSVFRRGCVPSLNAANAINVWDIQRSKLTTAASDIMMYLNQSIPVAYAHLLEVMVTVYVLLAPVGLVPSILWVAPLVTPLVTFFFYGTFVLTTEILLDPFRAVEGFATTSFLESGLLSLHNLEKEVPAASFWKGGGEPSEDGAAPWLDHQLPRSLRDLPPMLRSPASAARSTESATRGAQQPPGFTLKPVAAAVVQGSGALRRRGQGQAEPAGGTISKGDEVDT